MHIDLNTSIWRLKPLIKKLDCRLEILDSHNDYLIALTNKIHPNGSLVKIFTNEPTKWIKLTSPMSDAIVFDAKVFNNQIICNVVKGPLNFFSIYGHSGNHILSVTINNGYKIGGFSGNKDDEEIFFYLETYFLPPVVYKMDLKTYKFKLFKDTEISYDYKEYKLEIIDYTSKDGTKVPLTLVYKKGLELNGTNPTLLKSYGGFGLIHQADFDPALLYFLSKGGVYAYAHVRGEGTLGEDWEISGKRLKKQNTIDDFIAAAEYLIKEKYTSPQKLAITGGSNGGGLLVGAAMTQRPELFKLVIPIVGAFDMLRFEKFTVGTFHINEFGSVNILRDFKNLLSYSPYHNIKPGLNYPTTLVITSDNDTRVPPFHSYKFVAKLQNNFGQKNSILLRVEKNAGHNGSGTFNEDADMYAFILNTLEE